MITIPVLRKFDNDDVIGYMVLDETKLPEMPTYHFALGFHPEDVNMDDLMNVKFLKHKLLCVSLTDDDKFVRYEA